MAICPICNQDKALAYYAADTNSPICIDCHKQRDKEKIKKELTIKGSELALDTIEFQKEDHYNRKLEGLFYCEPSTTKPELTCSVCNKSVDKVIMTIETEHDPQNQNPFSYNFRTVYHCKNCLLEWLGLNNIKNGNKS
jgi:hypothetical protein